MILSRVEISVIWRISKMTTISLNANALRMKPKKKVNCLYNTTDLQSTPSKIILNRANVKHINQCRCYHATNPDNNKAP